MKAKKKKKRASCHSVWARHALTHAVQPRVNKKTHVGFNVQKKNQWAITWGYKDANREMWASVCVCEQAAEPGSFWFLLTFYISRSVAPHPYWGSPQRSGHFLSTVVWMCIIPSAQWTYVGCKCLQICARLAWTGLNVDTHELFVGPLQTLQVCWSIYLLYMDLHVFCYRVTARFCFCNEWIIYFLRAD